MAAYANPALHLKHQNELVDRSHLIESPQLTGETNNKLINRTVDATYMPDIAIIIFDLNKPPENNISAESRVLEISSNLQ